MILGTKTGPARALIAINQQGIPIILATDNDWIAADCNEICPDAEEIRLADKEDFPEPGLYLWEGFGELVNASAWDEPVSLEVFYNGTIRKVAPEEIAVLYTMKPPGDSENNNPRDV